MEWSENLTVVVIALYCSRLRMSLFESMEGVRGQYVAAGMCVCYRNAVDMSKILSGIEADASKIDRACRCYKRKLKLPMLYKLVWARMQRYILGSSQVIKNKSWQAKGVEAIDTRMSTR